MSVATFCCEHCGCDCRQVETQIVLLRDALRTIRDDPERHKCVATQVMAQIAEDALARSGDLVIHLVKAMEAAANWIEAREDDPRYAAELLRAAIAKASPSSQERTNT